MSAMSDHQTQTVQSSALPKEALGACRDFLRLLDQTSKLVGLYKAHHPVPTSSLQEAHDAMGKIMLHPNTTRVSLALAEGQSERLGVNIQAEQQASRFACGEQTGRMAACAERSIHVACSAFRA